MQYAVGCNQVLNFLWQHNVRFCIPRNIAYDYPETPHYSIKGRPQGNWVPSAERFDLNTDHARAVAVVRDYVYSAGIPCCRHGVPPHA